ncbi:vascular endothelial growth factor D-like [Anneissia japonica]|uniref:vascular endothelial growth factor D-like n=1 Tax=Anneissia japonica TaxID=1529436 RepID=UPI001425988B|nr:vascular endothelial growth factor D-like [Anneissia japonica]
MCRLVSPAFSTLLFLDILLVISCAAIPPWGKNQKLRELSYQVNPREMIEFAFKVSKEEAYAIFHEAYNRNRDNNSKISHIAAELELDGLSTKASSTMCKKPLPKVVNMYDILGISKNVVLSPAGIAVNKCSPDSGCCPPDEECVASEFRTKNFTYLHIENGELTVRRHRVLEDARCTCQKIQPFSSGQYSSSVPRAEECGENQEYDYTTGLCEEVEEEEEENGVEEYEQDCPEDKTFDKVTGRCECSIICPTGTSIDPSNCVCEDMPKPLPTTTCEFNRCPKPFHLNRTACTCDCYVDDRNCEKIKTGKKEVKEKHCLNVRRSRTYGTPTCIEGTFFNSTLGVCRCEDLL